MIKREDTYYCDFCGKSQHEVAKVVAGPDAIGICDACVALAAGICDGGHPKPAEWHQAQIDLVRDAERYRALRQTASGDLRTVWVELPLSGSQIVMGDNAKYLDAATDLLLSKQPEKANGL